MHLHNIVMHSHMTLERFMSRDLGRCWCGEFFQIEPSSSASTAVTVAKERERKERDQLHTAFGPRRPMTAIFAVAPIPRVFQRLLPSSR